MWDNKLIHNNDCAKTGKDSLLYENCDSILSAYGRKIGYNIWYAHDLFQNIDIVIEIESKSLEILNIPVLPTGCFLAIAKGDRFSYHSLYLCGVIDTVNKIILLPGEKYFIVYMYCGYSWLSLNNVEIEESFTDYQTNALKLDSHINFVQCVLDRASMDLSLSDRCIDLFTDIPCQIEKGSLDLIIKHCTRRIEEESGNIRVKELVKETGYSNRYVSIIFRKYLGLAPKCFCEIIRIKHSLPLLRDNHEVGSTADLANECGYFDQAHMNKQFHKMLGCSAGSYRKKGFRCLNYGKVNTIAAK